MLRFQLSVDVNHFYVIYTFGVEEVNELDANLNLWLFPSPQYLVAPPNSSVYTAIRNSHPPEEFYDQVCIVADDQTVEEGCPPEAAGTNRSKETDISVG